MYNTKLLLREEINLNNKKMLLSKQSIALIENSEYVKNVLGIQTPLNENYSFELRKQIITEATIMQDILQSANNYLGPAVEKGKKYAIQAISTVKSAKDVVLLFKSLILSPQNMIKANRALDKICNNLIGVVENFVTYITTKISNIAGFTDKLVAMLQHLKETITDEINGEGWRGFLVKFSLSVLLTYIKINFFDLIIKLGVGIANMANNLFSGIKGLLNMFGDFKETILQTLDIKNIVDWIFSIGKNVTTQNVKMAFDVLVALTTVSSTVLAAVNFKFDLTKK